MATAAYPPPSPYYKPYKDFSTELSSAPEPPPPVDGTYVHFGGNYTTDDVLPILEEQGVWQLYPKGQNVDIITPQARATLIHVLELQIQRRKQAVEDIKRKREEVQRQLRDSLSILDVY